MYYSQLRAFHAVATQGGFSKAAEFLHLTQPTLSDQVRKLEKDFDVLLFNRTSRSVSLTDAGKHLLSITNRLFECEAEAIEYLKDSQELLVGTLTLSADAPFHVLRIVRAFRNQYPGVTVNLKIGNSEDILNQLYDFEADVGVFSHVPDDARLKVLSLRDDPLVAVISKDHPWAGRGSVRSRTITPTISATSSSSLTWPCLRCRVTRTPTEARRSCSITCSRLATTARRAPTFAGCALCSSGSGCSFSRRAPARTRGPPRRTGRARPSRAPRRSRAGPTRRAAQSGGARARPRRASGRAATCAPSR